MQTTFMYSANMLSEAVVNQKGGVGKTATVLGLASVIAQQRDRRVLVVDLDPQANVTAGFGADASGFEQTTCCAPIAPARAVICRLPEEFGETSGTEEAASIVSSFGYAVSVKL